MLNHKFKGLCKYSQLLILSLVLNFSSSVVAQTLVRVSTNLGDFDIELFDAETPGTVQNFLNYITSDRYAESFVHRSVPGFVIQGGGFRVEEESTLILSVDTDPPILNEPGISNLRGTVAMAKVAGDPNSATSQWFVNLADNSFLDSDNGGFTVFGQVVGEGMAVVESISQLSRVSLGGALTDLPVLNFDGSSVNREDLVFTDISLLEETQAANRFDSDSGYLIFNINAGSAGIVEMTFSIDSTEPEVVLRGLAETVVVLESAGSHFATFDAQTGQLVIPELEVEGSIAFRNLTFVVADVDQLLFRLESFE